MITQRDWSCCVLPVTLQTNNPRKMDVLTQLGVKITGRIPCQVQAGQYNEVCRWIVGVVGSVGCT